MTSPRTAAALLLVAAVLGVGLTARPAAAHAATRPWSEAFTIGHLDPDSDNLGFEPQLATATDGRGDIVVACRTPTGAAPRASR